MTMQKDSEVRIVVGDVKVELVSRLGREHLSVTRGNRIILFEELLDRPDGKQQARSVESLRTVIEQVEAQERELDEQRLIGAAIKPKLPVPKALRTPRKPRSPRRSPRRRAAS